MRVQPSVAVLPALLVLVAGCTGTQEESGSDSGPTGDAPLPGPNATLGVVQFLDCYEHGLKLEVSYKTVRPQVPPAFEVIGFTSETAGIYVQIFTCGRVVNETAVLGSAHLLTSWAFVKPRNESWTPDITSNSFLLDVVMDDEALREALAAWNWTSAAGTFENTATPDLPNGRGDVWRVQAAAFEVGVSLLEHDLTAQASGEESYWWYGDGPFHRVTYRVNDTVAALQDGEIHVVGNSRLGSAMGQASAHALGRLSLNSSFTFTYDGSWN